MRDNSYARVFGCLGTVGILFAIPPGALGQDGTRTQTKPVNISVSNTTFTAGGNVSGTGTIASPAGSILGSTSPGTGMFNFSARSSGSSPVIGSLKFNVGSGSGPNAISVIGQTYAWIHVALTKQDAQIRGTATVNGITGYSFLLTVHKSAVTTGTAPGVPASGPIPPAGGGSQSGPFGSVLSHSDFLRLQVTHMVGTNTIVDYDNLRGKPDTFFLAPYSAARILTGSIQIKP